MLDEDKGDGSTCEVTVRPRRSSCVLPLTAPMPSGPVPYILPGIPDFSLTFRKIYTSAALSSQAQMAMSAGGWHRGSFGICAERQQPLESMRRTKGNHFERGGNHEDLQGGGRASLDESFTALYK